MYRTIQSCLALAKKLASGQKLKKDIKVVTAADEILKLKELQWPIFAFDFETTSECAWADGAAIRTVAISNGEVAYAFPWTEEAKETFEFLLRHSVRTYVYNLQFEFLWIEKVWGIDAYSFNIDDVMLFNYLLDENRGRYSLKDLVAEHFGNYDVLVEDFKNVSMEDLLYYNAEDALYTAILGDTLRERLRRDHQLWGVYKNISKPAAPMLAEMSYDGVKIDKDTIRQVQKSLEEEIGKIRAEIEPIIGGDISARKPLTRYFYDFKGYEPIMTNKGNLSVSEAALKQIAREQKDKVAQKLLEFRKKQTLIDKYVIPYLQFDSDRVHGQFHQHVTRTGRLSSSKPNLQQIPRDKRIKNFFVTGKKAFILLQADLSQAELRVACTFANESTMIKIYREDGDIHRKTAAESIYNIPEDQVTKEQRQFAKQINFGYIYGQEATGFRLKLAKETDIIISQEEAERIRNNFFATYSALPRWYALIRKVIEDNHQIRTPFGRLRRFPGYAEMSQEEKEEVIRQAINAPVQSTSSDINLFAMLELKSAIRKDGLNDRIRFLLTVHDSLLLELEDRYIPWVRSILDASINQWKWLKVPMRMDYEIGERWGELEEIA